MNPKYLGETPIKINRIPEEWAMLYISSYGGIDGEHHKTWVIDQVARILMGTPVTSVMAKWSDGNQEERFQTEEPSYEYQCWRDDIAKSGYGYDEGIVP